MPKPIHISDRIISSDRPPFIIAEISGNHNGSLDRALKIVEAAAAAGADAIKLQTYTADTMTLDIHEGSFVIDNPNSLWNTRSLYDLYQEAYTPWKWHKPIFERAKELGILAFSSAFDTTAVDFLMELEVPCFKIASFESTDIPLLRYMASTGKPIILSTGMASFEEIDLSLHELKSAGAEDIIILKCTSSYPASPKDSNLATIKDMKEKFGVPVGLSDHTLGIGAAVASIAYGACVIEKHVTLSRADEGVDAAFSMEPVELKALAEESYRAWEALGNVQYGPSDREKESLIFRRSLYFVKDIQNGEIVTKEHIRSIRPGNGLEPKYFDKVIGMIANQDITYGTPVSFDILDKVD